MNNQAAQTMPELRELAQRAIPFLRDEGSNYEDDGNNEPLELARAIEAALAGNPNRDAANPGGCECEKCGRVFIGAEWHVLCGICVDHGVAQPDGSGLRNGDNVSASTPEASPQPQVTNPAYTALSQTAGVAEPHQECYSSNFDTWYDSPSDIEFVDGLKVGDTYKLQVSHYSVEREYVVTKAPDETSDDYEVQPLAAAPAASGGDGIYSPVSPEEEAAIDTAAGLAKVVLRLPIELLGEIDHRAQQDGCVRNAYLRELLAKYHSKPLAAASVSERARALLAAECPECGGSNGYMVPAGEHGGAWQKCSTCQDGERLNSVSRYQALRAIEQALTQQRWHGTTGSMEQAEKATFVPCDCGCGRSCCAMCGNDVGFLTPQPSADAVRELVKRAVSALTSHDQFNWALADPTLVDDLNSIMEGRTDA